MQSKCPRTDFGQLLARAWKLYGESLHVAFPALLLFGALPILIVLFVSYFGLASGFEPVLRVAQAVLRSLLENGFDEWAIGAAVEQVLSSFGGLNPLEVILRAAGSLGIAALVLVLMLPVLAACRMLLTPVGRGASLRAQLCALYGDKPRFSASFSAIRRRVGRLIALEFLMLPVSAAGILLAVLACITVRKLPVAGNTVGLAVCLGVLVLISGVRQLAILHVLGNDARVFPAFDMAFRRFFTDWIYIAAGGLFYAGLALGTVFIFAADVLLMVLAMLPPFAVVLYMALFLPLGQALNAVMLQEQIRRTDKSVSQSPENKL